MHYVCVENNEVTAILNYRPNVPASVSVYTVSPQDAQDILDGKSTFDLVTKTVKKNEPLKDQRENYEKINFLNSTDWKVMRHIREQALGINTSMSDSEYLDLEQKRHAAATTIQR